VGEDEGLGEWFGVVGLGAVMVVSAGRFGSFVHFCFCGEEGGGGFGCGRGGFRGFNGDWGWNRGNGLFVHFL